MNLFNSGILHSQKNSEKSLQRVASDIYTSYCTSTKIYLDVQDTLFLNNSAVEIKEMRKVFQ
jgi:hypothetical protein